MTMGFAFEEKTRKRAMVEKRGREASNMTEGGSESTGNFVMAYLAVVLKRCPWYPMSRYTSMIPFNNNATNMRSDIFHSSERCQSIQCILISRKQSEPVPHSIED